MRFGRRQYLIAGVQATGGDMGLRPFVFIATVAATAWCLAGSSNAQDSSHISKPATSYGITGNVVALIYRQDHASAQIILKNNNNFRVYLTDAREDTSQHAFFGSGAQVNSPFPDGLPFCNGGYSDCVRNPNETTLDKFSYIEPGATLAMAMNYQMIQKPSQHDTISFSLTCMARFAKSSANPDDVGPVKRLTLSFQYLPLVQE